jgi:glycosyltransferase involved in cell wall biosynthesis
MHTLLIHQIFARDADPGSTRHFELARYAAKAGDRFTVITGDVSYLTGKPVTDRRRWMSEEYVDEKLRVLHIFTPACLHRSYRWRLFAFWTFMSASLIAALRVEPMDVMMGTSPPLFQALSAWMVAAIRRKPFLLEIRDLWPAFAIDIGLLKSPVAIALSRWLESFLYARATHLLVNSPAYRDYLVSRGVPFQKISLVANGVEPDMFDPVHQGADVRSKFALADKFVVTYAGAMGMANDLGTLLEAAERLCERTEIQFLLVGDGKERPRLQMEARSRGLVNITFAGSQPKNRMAAFLAASDACVALLKDIPAFRTTYPNKVFDYMAAGRPTVLAIDGAIRQVMETAQGGIYVPPGNAVRLAEAIGKLADDPPHARQMGVAAREYVVQYFNRQDQARTFIQLLRTLAGGSSREMTAN